MSAIALHSTALVEVEIMPFPNELHALKKHSENCCCCRHHSFSPNDAIKIYFQLSSVCFYTFRWFCVPLPRGGGWDSALLSLFGQQKTTAKKFDKTENWNLLRKQQLIHVVGVSLLIANIGANTDAATMTGQSVISRQFFCCCSSAMNRVFGIIIRKSVRLIAQFH